MARTRDDYVALARKYARQYGVPETIFLAQIQQESGWNPSARSYADARGIAQIVPRWHPDVNPSLPGKQLPGVNPEWDLAYGARLMSSHLKRYGSIERALSAYNSGKPDAYLNPNFAKGQTHQYVAKILAGAKNWKGSSSPVGQMAAVSQAMGSPTPAASSDDLKRRAVMQALVAQQNAYLGGEDYSGPNAMQLYQQMQAAQPASAAGDFAEDRVPGPQAADLMHRVPKGKGGAQLMLALIKEAERRGLRAAENPYVDKVDPVHTHGSDHYKTPWTINGKKLGAGLDVSGSAKALRDYFLWASQYAGKGLKDVFYDPMGYSFDEGRRWNRTIGGHGKHVHLSVFG